jgi:ribosomal protein S18 acetylase RimI-like enzyme
VVGSQGKSVNDDVMIRGARVEDARAIKALHERCASDLLAGVVADYVPPLQERTEIERSWTGPLGSPHPRHALLVAERFEHIVGFVAVGPTRDADDHGDSTGQLRVVIVDPDERGAGVGTALVGAGERAMRESCLSVATLWVVPENTSAIRCYERCGWRADGTERFGEFGGHMVRSIRFRKRLSTASLPGYAPNETVA